ncbi:MAG: Ig-like domain-containing protein [Gammaproteobacteria bacterium]
MPLALAVLCGPALAGISAGSTGDAAASPAHHATALPAALRPALYQALAKDSGSAYRVNRNGCATLPEQKLKACFDSHGAHFSGAGSLTLHLIAYGRKNNLAVVKAVKPTIRSNRVSYIHGLLTAWWRVLPMGFEQGFTITKRPAGHGELILALAANGRADEHKGTLAWGKLRYGRLVVTDAKGKVIPATLKSRDNRIQIAINDFRATYPLMIDPMVWIEQKVTSGDDYGMNTDSFGSSVALQGTTAFIGDPLATLGGNYAQGVAYVFMEKNGTWGKTQKLMGSDGTSADKFGSSIALDGSVAMIGAPKPDLGKLGEVYVFTKENSAWSEAQELTASDGSKDDFFGYSVALGSSTALIGAPQADGDQGAVYVFTEENGVWTESQKLLPEVSEIGFGISVAMDGSTALIGAPDSGLGGAVYVFTKSNGVWSYTQKFAASDAGFGDSFGDSVVLDDTTALVSAYQASQGAAYVFNKENDNWSEAQKLTKNDGYNFGHSIALDDSTMLIGAQDVINGTLQDVVYVYTRINGVWSETRELIESGGYGFGQSIALDGVRVLIGAVGGIAGNSAYFYGRNDFTLNVSAPQTAGKGTQFFSQTIVTNNSSTSSPAVSVSFAPPAGALFLSATATQGKCIASSTVICDFGAVGGNAGTATANIKFKAIGKKGSIMRQLANVTHAEPALTASGSTTITNAPPVASDGTLTTNENTAASGPLKASDPDGDPLTFNIVDKPMHGTVALDAQDTGSYTYTPNDAYIGSDSFTFKANDGQADSNVATISITVKAAPPPPPPPSPSGSGGGSTGPFGLGLLALLGLFAAVRRRHRLNR